MTSFRGKLRYLNAYARLLLFIPLTCSVVYLTAKEYEFYSRTQICQSK